MSKLPLFYISADADEDFSLNLFVAARDADHAMSLWRNYCEENEWPPAAEEPSCFVVPTEHTSERVVPWHESDGVQPVEIGGAS